MMSLHSRAGLRAVSMTGVVHRAYLCDGQSSTYPDGVCPTRLHGWCDYNMALPRRTGRAVSCKRCKSGGSTWAAFIARIEHPELEAAEERLAG